MNAETMTKIKWFWPWQDENEEAWLGEMSANGWRLTYISLPCVYTFAKSAPARIIYRLDFFHADKGKFSEYQRIFRDAGWEYIGQLSNWQYWRKQVAEGEVAEIYTDVDSKLRKYRRLLGFLTFFLFFLVFMGMNLVMHGLQQAADLPSLIRIVTIAAVIAYGVLILIYLWAMVKVYWRINQLKKTVVI
jgi:hypothetical protein